MQFNRNHRNMFAALKGRLTNKVRLSISPITKKRWISPPLFTYTVALILYGNLE